MYSSQSLMLENQVKDQSVSRGCVQIVIADLVVIVPYYVLKHTLASRSTTVKSGIESSNSLWVRRLTVPSATSGSKSSCNMSIEVWEGYQTRNINYKLPHVQHHWRRNERRMTPQVSSFAISSGLSSWEHHSELKYKWYCFDSETDVIIFVLSLEVCLQTPTRAPQWKCQIYIRKWLMPKKPSRRKCSTKSKHIARARYLLYVRWVLFQLKVVLYLWDSLESIATFEIDLQSVRSNTPSWSPLYKGPRSPEPMLHVQKVQHVYSSSTCVFNMSDRTFLLGNFQPSRRCAIDKEYL